MTSTLTNPKPAPASAPPITTLGKFVSDGTRSLIKSRERQADPLLAMITEGIELLSSSLLRAAEEQDRLEARQRESTILLGAIVRGRHAWHQLNAIGVPIDAIDPARSPAEIAREIRVYLGFRSGLLEGCDTLTRAEVRLEIRDASGTLARGWM